MPNKKNFSVLSIEVQNIVKNFDNIKALSNVSFNAQKGEVIALLGPNGAGKSTLMNIIAGYMAPSNGQVFVNGKNVETQDLLTKRDIGFLPEGSPLYGDMSVALFLKYFIELKLKIDNPEQLSPKQLKEIYHTEFLRITKTSRIEKVLNQKIETLSKGYTRRVGFATSLIGNPPVLLLDEPTDGLDPNQKEHICQLIQKMSKDKTIIISTHLLEEAEQIASRIILINQGKIIVDGTLKEILSKAKKKTLEAAFKSLTQNGDTYE